LNSMSLPNVYCFVSGKNWKLSLAEITSFLKARDYVFEVSEFSRSFFTLRLQTTIQSSLIDELGGILKIAEKTVSIPTEQLLEVMMSGNSDEKKQLKEKIPFDLLTSKMPSTSSGKMLFGVSVYWADPSHRPVGNMAQRFIGTALKETMRKNGKKTRFMGFPRDRKNPQLTPVEVLKQNLVDSNSEIVLFIGKNETIIGTTRAVHNPFEFQKRDLDKPIQRKIFGISPRVAKIMINLADCAPGKTFLDPFCGVGTFLQEALLIHAKVIGLDINRWCVEAAKRNLQWIEREYSLSDADYVVLQGDAKRLTSKIRDQIDSIATEPDLGPALREIPTTPYAEKIVNKLMPLFEDFLSESYDVLKVGGFAVFVTPFIKTRSGKPVTMNIEAAAKSIGFEIVMPFSSVLFVEAAAGFPLVDLDYFVDVDEKHKVGRKISVLRKV
jgi:tRNA G10  N-methylase Trm11